MDSRIRLCHRSASESYFRMRLSQLSHPANEVFKVPQLLKFLKQLVRLGFCNFETGAPCHGFFCPRRLHRKHLAAAAAATSIDLQS